jgi:hypothetical protein
MGFSSPLDDAYAIGNDDSDAAHGVVSCLSIRHLLGAVFVLIGEVMTLCCGYTQSASTAINGTIADPSAAQIPDGPIVVRNVDTSIQRITSSGSAGTYSGIDLVSGNYSLQVAAEFGVVTSTANAPRQLQIALKLTF